MSSEKIFLFPGRLVSTKKPDVISTVLGSCVAVILYDRAKSVAGMCHYLLAEPKISAGKNGRYGTYAIPRLLEDVTKLGANPRGIEAKIYGGGSVIADFASVGVEVGQGNIKKAREALAELGIPIVEEEVGGECGRHITLDCSDFSVEHKLVGRDNQLALAGTEKLEKKGKTRVLIVDDSATARRIFEITLSKDPSIEVIGTAIDPYDAREKIVKLNPDVVTLDIEMPRMNGVTFLEKIMKHKPLPVVMVSSLGSDGEAAMRSLELGAVEFVHKPSQFDPQVLRELAQTLVPKVKAAACIRPSSLKKGSPSTTKSSRSRDRSTDAGLGGIELICVGGNLGGAESLLEFLPALAQDTPPIIVTMSTIAPFVQKYIERIAGRCRMTLKVCENEQFVRPGNVYFAPSDRHCVVSQDGKKLSLIEGPTQNGQRPSFQILLKSAVETLGPKTVPVFLSGFGNDGIEAATKHVDLGGKVLVQDPETSKQNSLAVGVIQAGLATAILSPSGLGETIMQMRNKGITGVAI